MSVEPWIGFAHVLNASGSDALGAGRKGAFTHALALATDARDFRAKVETSLCKDGLFLLELDDVAPLSAYEGQGRATPDIRDVAAILSDATPVQFDIFDAYLENDS